MNHFEYMYKSPKHPGKAQKDDLNSAFPFEPDHVSADGEFHPIIMARVKPAKEAATIKAVSVAGGFVGKALEAQAAAASGVALPASGSVSSGIRAAPPPGKRRRTR